MTREILHVIFKIVYYRWSGPNGCYNFLWSTYFQKNCFLTLAQFANKKEFFQWWKYACFSSSFYGSFHLRNSFQWTLASAAIIINVTFLLRTSFLWVCVISDKIVTCVFKSGSLKRNTINRSKYFVITQGRNYYIWWTSLFLVNHSDMFFCND